MNVYFMFAFAVFSYIYVNYFCLGLLHSKVLKIPQPSFYVCQSSLFKHFFIHRGLYVPLRLNINITSQVRKIFNQPFIFYYTMEVSYITSLLVIGFIYFLPIKQLTRSPILHFYRYIGQEWRSYLVKIC